MNEQAAIAQPPVASAASAKRQRITKSIDIDYAKRTVRFVFGDGQVLTVELDKCPEVVDMQLKVYGLKRKVADAFSQNEGIADAFTKAHTCRENLYKGIWATKTSGPSNLSEAIGRLRGMTQEEAMEWIGSLGDDKLKALPKHPTVKAMIATIVAERAEDAAHGTAAIDWDELG